MLVCRDCFHTTSLTSYHSDSNVCNVCNGNNVVDIDDEFTPFIIAFWKLGLDSAYCCAGHYISKDKNKVEFDYDDTCAVSMIRMYQTPYIVFSFDKYNDADNFIKRYGSDSSVKVNFGLYDSCNFPGHLIDENTPNIHVIKRTTFKDTSTIVKYHISVYSKQVNYNTKDHVKLISSHHNRIANFWKFMHRLVLDYKNEKTSKVIDSVLGVTKYD